MTGPTLHINDRKQIKRMKSLICLALLFLALSVRGQGITLTGNVRDGKDQSALQDVNVVISSQGHKDNYGIYYIGSERIFPTHIHSCQR